MIKSTFSKNLQLARKNKGWSQQGAAATIGIRPNHYGRIERGEREPSLRIFARICKAFNVDDPVSFVENENYFMKQAA